MTTRAKDIDYNLTSFGIVCGVSVVSFRTSARSTLYCFSSISNGSGYLKVWDWALDLSCILIDEKGMQCCLLLSSSTSISSIFHSSIHPVTFGSRYSPPVCFNCFYIFSPLTWLQCGYMYRYKHLRIQYGTWETYYGSSNIHRRLSLDKPCCNNLTLKWANLLLKSA